LKEKETSQAESPETDILVAKLAELGFSRDEAAQAFDQFVSF